MGKMSNLVQESLAGAHVIRAFAREAAQQKQFDAQNAEYYRANVALSWTQSIVFRLAATIGGVGALVSIYYGAGQVLAAR